MDNNSLVGIILVVVVLLILLYAIYYVSQQRKKKSVAPVTKPVPQTPVVVAPVQATQEPKPVPQTSMVVTPKADQVQPTPEPKPVPQTPAVTAPVQPAPAPKPVSQAPVVAAPVQPAITEGEVKIKQPVSQATKVSMESTPEPKPVPQTPAVTAPVQPAPAPKTMDRGSKIIDIEGIGPVYAAKLNSVNIYTTSDMLKAGETPMMRRELAEKTSISHDLILRWVNMADLFRIRGVGEEYSDLLEAAGVDTVVELAKRVPEHLHMKMLEVNGEKKLVKRPPGLSMVERWVKEAKTLPRKIEY